MFRFLRIFICTWALLCLAEGSSRVCCYALNSLADLQESLNALELESHDPVDTMIAVVFNGALQKVRRKVRY